MLYRFDRVAGALDELKPVHAHGVGILEKEVESAVAGAPHALFRTTAAGPPVLVIKKSVPYRKMPDIVALDGEGRVVLVECKRSWATREAVAQILDYAADYATDPWVRLCDDWR